MITYTKKPSIDNIEEDKVFQKLNERKFLNILKTDDPHKLYNLKTLLTDMSNISNVISNYKIEDLDISYLIILNMLSFLGHKECDNWDNTINIALNDIKEFINFDTRLLIPPKKFKIPKNLERIYFAKMSPFKFYHFWYDVAEKNIDRLELLFLYYTELTIEEITEILNKHNESPKKKCGQLTFAYTITKRYFNDYEVQLVLKANHIMNGNDNRIKEISLDLLDLFKEELPPIFEFSKLPIHAYRLLLNARIKKSMGEGKKIIRQSKLFLNGKLIEDEKYMIQMEDLIQNKWLFIRIDTKEYYLAKYVGPTIDYFKGE